ncbi:MAG: type IX secretion system outer membrane channel protein PorV [Bacteroidales bacterium]|nr:type IX secretion system outer membrane channel protein PorV [Bacteroidales bacterium]
MMNKPIRLVFASLLIITASPGSNAQDENQDFPSENTLKYSVPFLTIAPDSRAGAMGDAGVATSPDVNALHWNPAKYAFIEKDMGVSISYTPWLKKLVNDINLAYLAGYKRLDDEQVISGSLLYFSLGNIQFRDQFGEFYGQHAPNEFAIDAAYSRKFGEHFSGGIAFRYIRSDITGGTFIGGSESKAGNSVAGDVSVYYQNPGIQVQDKEMDLALGLNIRNIGSKISYTTVKKNFIPTTMRLGASFNFHLDQYNSLMLTADLNKLLVPTPPLYELDSDGNQVTDENGDLVIDDGYDPNVSVTQGMLQSFYDAPKGLREELHEIKYSFGMEYWYQDVFAVRSGYFHEHQTKGNRKYFTVGVGLKLNVFQADFSYLIPRFQNHPLSNTVRFSLTLDFGALSQEKNQ